jgi:hypothetical protein
MALRVVDIADGYESETVPSVVSVVGLRASERILSASEIIAGKIVLSIAPAIPSTVTLFWDGICQYTVGNDFMVSGAEVIFAGYNLGSLLQAGDLVRVTYQ